jgi:hypothetical protein
VTTVSLNKFTAVVQEAVKAAIAKHPKFKIEAPNNVTISYLIRGIPVPEAILASVTLGETQAFAAEVASHIAGAQPELVASAGRGAGSEGAILSIGRHVLIGIPPVVDTIRLER